MTMTMTSQMAIPLGISESPEPEIVRLRFPDEVVLSDYLNSQLQMSLGWGPKLISKDE
jgi:hypothetical protein